MKIIPIDKNNIPDGNYWFGVFVDSGDEVDEIDEENNVVYADMMIVVGSIQSTVTTQKFSEIKINAITPTPTPSAWEPQSFYGKAEFNSYPLRIGDRIMATTEGIDLSNPTNPISVVNFGEYSYTEGKELLTVEVPYVSLSQDAPISFWIKPGGFDYWYKAQCKDPLSGSNWSYSSPFSPGSIKNLDLKSSESEEFMYFNDILGIIKSPILPDNYNGW